MNLDSITSSEQKRQGFYRQFGTVFIPLTILLIIISVAMYFIQGGAQRGLLSSQVDADLDSGYKTVQSKLSAAVVDVHYLAGESELNAYLSEPLDERRSGVVNTLVFLMQEDPAYDRLSVYTEDGVESLRVTKGAALLDETGKTVSLPDDQLAALRSLEPAQVSLTAAAGGGAASSSGVLRFAAPVKSQDGRLMGAVVLDYVFQGASILPEEGAGSLVVLALLDGSGNWLTIQGDVGENSYTGRPFGTTFSQDWQEISTSPAGQFASDAGIFSFRTFDPQQVLSAPEKVALVGAGPAQAYPWHLVAFIPQSLVAVEVNDVLQGILVTDLPLLVAILIVSVVLGHAWSVREQADNAMSLTERVFESTSEGIMVTDSKSNILSVNKGFTAITGYLPAEAVGKTPRILKSGQHDDHFYRQMWEALRLKGFWQGEIWNRHKDGTLYPQWLRIRAMEDERRANIYYVAVFNDISERKQAERQMDYLTTHDTLTRLPNRSLFQNQLGHAIAVARRNRLHLAVLIIDLDNFKEINEIFGHALGDRVLQETANRLRMCLRESDTVARIGGDEFCVVLENLYDRENAIIAVERILNTLAAPYQLGEETRSVTASIGISIFPDDAEDVDQLMKFADTAMYQGKAQGKDNYYFYSEQS